MAKDPQEWLKQAEYDLDTAEYMFKGGRYFYAVFMCHLSIEKALKGIYQKKNNKIPPKKHNLIYFLNEAKIKPPEDIGKFLIKLNQASIVTRYPEELAKIQKVYTKPIVKQILTKTGDTLEWTKTLY